MVDTPNRTAHRIQAEGNSPVSPRLMGSYFHGTMSNAIAHLDREGGSQNKAPFGKISLLEIISLSASSMQGC